MTPLSAEERLELLAAMAETVSALMVEGDLVEEFAAPLTDEQCTQLRQRDAFVRVMGLMPESERAAFREQFRRALASVEDRSDSVTVPMLPEVREQAKDVIARVRRAAAVDDEVRAHVRAVLWWIV